MPAGRGHCTLLPQTFTKREHPARRRFLPTPCVRDEARRVTTAAQTRVQDRGHHNAAVDERERLHALWERVESELLAALALSDLDAPPADRLSTSSTKTSSASPSKSSWRAC